MQRQTRWWWTFVGIVAIVRVVVVAAAHVVVVATAHVVVVAVVRIVVAVVGAGVVCVNIVAAVSTVYVRGPRRWGEILLA